jgi:hypothetical protein
LSSRLLRDVFGVPSPVDDEALVDGWVRLMMGALCDPASEAPGVDGR